MTQYAACGRCRRWGDLSRTADQHGLVCDNCYAEIFALAQARLVASKQPDPTRPVQVVEAELAATRLGHTLRVPLDAGVMDGVWGYYLDAGRVFKRSVCARCWDHVDVEGDHVWGKATIRGPAVVLRCKNAG